MTVPRITLLSGGVGGAKLAEGLARSRYGDKLTIIANVGDDCEFHGLHVSPDVDTLMYTLGNQINREQGWGVIDDSYRTLGRLEMLGAGDTWMQLGDLDFATHIRRTELLRAGQRLTEVTMDLCHRVGVKTSIHLPTDDPVRTRIKTDLGWLKFQEYFVRERCQCAVRDIAFDGAQQARPAPEALVAIAQADCVVIAPSNPLVSIGPMLAVPGFSSALCATSAPKIAVSPLICGKTVKGPADVMLKAKGYSADPLGLAACYGDLVDTFVIDRRDHTFTARLQAQGFGVLEEDILMQCADDKLRLAEAVVAHALQSKPIVL